MSLQNCLYSKSDHTVVDVVEHYSKELRDTGDVTNILHANKLMAYRNLILDKSFLRDSRRFFNKLYSLISTKHPYLHFYIEGRRKSLISTEKKIIQYFEMSNSLDLIKDFFAFRIILFGDEEVLDLKQHCYYIVQEIIDFAIEEGYVPCEGLPLIGVNSSNNKESTFLYKEYIKDYINSPKENGYQSIHLVLVDAKGRNLEVQVRTSSMHLQAEKGGAEHVRYKASKYSDYAINRERISIDGYECYSARQQIIDYLKNISASESVLLKVNDIFKDNIISKENVSALMNVLKTEKTLSKNKLFSARQEIIKLTDRVIDLAGVEKAVSIFQRQKTF